MSRAYAVVQTLIALITSGSVAAADQHIACNFSLPATAAIRSDDGAMQQTLTFFLDDANKQLVAEGGPVVSARTTAYSDTEVRADIKINSLPANAAAQIAISRGQGTAVITILVLPAGMDVETGDCHEVAAPQTQ
jgi:hypothetical protein